MRPKTIITYEIKGFQQTIAILPDKGRTYKVIDKADTAELLVNHGLLTYVAARAWVSSYLFMQYNVIVDEIDIDWIETTNPITRAAIKARTFGNRLYRYRYTPNEFGKPWARMWLEFKARIHWQADLSNFSFKKRTRV